MKINDEAFFIVHGAFLGFLTRNMHSVFFKFNEDNNKLDLIVFYLGKQDKLETHLLETEIIPVIKDSFIGSLNVELTSIEDCEDLGAFKMLNPSFLKNFFPIVIGYDYREYDEPYLDI